MNILTFIGLGLDLFGALLLVIGDPPAHNTFLLRLRYIADKHHPTVSKVKDGYTALLLGCLIYKNEEDAISEEHPGRIEVNSHRQVGPRKLQYLYRVAIMRDNFFLLKDEFSQPFLIHGDYELYKIKFTDEYKSKINEPTIDFVHRWVGRTNANRDEYLTHSEPENEFEENLIEYLNSKYIRSGSYLLVVGFSLQIIGAL